MKNRFSITLAIFLLCLASASGWAAQPATPERFYRLAMTGSYPDDHPVVHEVIAPWLAEIAAKTDNRLLITYYAPNVLLPEHANIEGVRKNSVALADQGIRNVGGTRYLSSFLSVPAGISSSRSATQLFWRMYRNTPELRKELEDFKLLSLHASPPAQLHLSFPLRNIADLKGKRILCQDAYLAEVLGSLGATPIVLPLEKHVEAFKNGLADGLATGFDLALAHKLERLPLVQSVRLNLNVDPHWICMNKSAWDALPLEYKRVLDAGSGEALSLRIAEALDMAAAAGQARMAGRGAYIKAPTSAEDAHWRKALSEAGREIWLNEMKVARIPEPDRILQRAKLFYNESEATANQP